MRIFYSEVFKDHKPEGYHPENPKRLELVIEGLKEHALWINVEQPPMAGMNDILKVHSNEYVKKIQGLSERGFSFVDPDTYVSPHTWEAALTAFGASMEVAKLALKKKDVYLALVRPPGHHAGKKGRALGAPTLGFCIFNNAAGAALTLKEKVGKVVIIDFDVHHGNGTQDIFWDDGDIIHIDLHEGGIYPGSGNIYEIGGKGAEGTDLLPALKGED
ncbi:hypothetical protein K1720_03775 [Thermococcus argininiproducens]|uniref:Histone deacetylase domain-containing protein n=1 Tax=Thermococcus argininiproducens TaxID=2866384 RepID=A0A9E7MC61_9EURY|nr:hypothetical protein K1720_03775 [Thermococcus argininiproducens]